MFKKCPDVRSCCGERALEQCLPHRGEDERPPKGTHTHAVCELLSLQLFRSHTSDRTIKTLQISSLQVQHTLTASYFISNISRIKVTDHYHPPQVARRER